MTSQPTSFLSEVLSESPIRPGKKVYFRERLKSSFHETIVNLFREKRNSGEMTRAELARKIGKRPEQITRILNASGNLRLSTVSDVLLGLGYYADIQPIKLEEVSRNYSQPSWMEDNNLDFKIKAGGPTIVDDVMLTPIYEMKSLELSQ